MRNRLVTIAGAVLVALPVAALAGKEGPQRQKVVGYFAFVSKGDRLACLEQLRRGLARHGHVEGKNIEIRVAYMDRDERTLPARVDELLSAKPDVLVAAGVHPLTVMQARARTTPIVSLGAGSMKSMGLIDSLVRPGKNVTGFSIGDEEHATKALELLAQALPEAKSIGIVLNANNPVHRTRPGVMGATATRLGRRLVLATFASRDAIGTAWRTLADEGVDAVLVHPDLWIYLEAHAREAARHRLPAMASNPIFVAVGGLMSYGIEVHKTLCEDAARYADQILRGRSPADLPVEELRDTELVINMKLARSLGISFPPAVTARAARLVE